MLENSVSTYAPERGDMTDQPFVGVSEEICKAAFRIIRPAISAAATDGIVNREAGHLVVLDPAIPYEPKYRNAIADLRFGSLVLWSESIGDALAHDLEKYAAIAEAKAFTSYLTGLPSHLVQQQFPSLYVPTMTKWGGSAVAGVGPMRLIVAFSGVQWNFDQMFSEMMLSAIQAICLERMRDVMASIQPLIGSSWTA